MPKSSIKVIKITPNHNVYKNCWGLFWNVSKVWYDSVMYKMVLFVMKKIAKNIENVVYFEKKQ